MDDQNLILCDGLVKIYKIANLEVVALQGLDLLVRRGELLGIVGASGSGKSTLMNILGGLDRPDKGTVRVFGHDLAKMGEKDLTRWRRKEVGFIFQSLGLLPTLSAYENIELMLRIAEASRKEKKQRTGELLDLVGLGKWMHHRPYELSGGQQQRVAIARAVANRPRLILADEPTGELDSTTAREILTLFRNIVKHENLTVLMSSHDPLVDGYVDEIFQMKDGQIINNF